MDAHLRETESVWPHRFEFSLETYRRRGILPHDTRNLYFGLWLFEDPGADRTLLNRYNGPHPQQSIDQRSTYYAAATRQDVRRWIEEQRTVLAELAWIATETERELEAGGGEPAVGLCRELMAAVAEEHRTEAARLVAEIRGPNRDRVNLLAPWSERAREQREARERNQQYGGGHSSR